MIVSFRDTDTEKIFSGQFSKRFQAVAPIALRKLMYLNQADSLQDLGAIPGHHLKALAKDRKGQHSIRVNDQYRICFTWTSSGPQGVEIE